MSKLRLYIVQFVHSRGNGYALVKAYSPNQAENVLKTQTSYNEVNVVVIRECKWQCREDQIQVVEEGAVTTYGPFGKPGTTFTYNDMTLEDKEDLLSLIDADVYEKARQASKSALIAERSAASAESSAKRAEQAASSTYSKEEVNTLLSSKADTSSLATVAKSGSYNDLKDKPSVVPQKQADWAQENSTAVDYIKHKPSVYTKSEVNALIPAPEVFEAQYGVTTYEEVVAAYNAGKIVIVKYYYQACDLVFVLQGFPNRVNVGNAEFIACRGGIMYVMWITPQSTWTAVQVPLEQSGNKVTSISSLSNNYHYPSAKCVYDELQKKADKVPIVEVISGATVTQALRPNTFYEFGVMDSLTITLTAGESGYLAIYACSFTAATDNTTLTLPATIIGEAPTIAAGHRYELNIMDNVLLYTENGND